MAQATDKDRSTSTTSKQSTTKSSAAKPAANEAARLLAEQQHQGNGDAARGAGRERADARQGRLALRPFGRERRLTSDGAAQRSDASPGIGSGSFRERWPGPEDLRGGRLHDGRPRPRSSPFAA
jgi:hypothetical protein